MKPPHLDSSSLHLRTSTAPRLDGRVPTKVGFRLARGSGDPGRRVSSRSDPVRPRLCQFLCAHLVQSASRADLLSSRSWPCRDDRMINAWCTTKHCSGSQRRSRTLLSYVGHFPPSSRARALCPADLLFRDDRHLRHHTSARLYKGAQVCSPSNCHSRRD